ncbi:ATP-binding protein [Streptomyces sp. RLB1-33]|uniref:ATP-binding protein n=1 Tax=Streptomyces mirabilis TaxID=68239 RepID=UPI002001E136|nr:MULTISPECIES: ATP-binding protein [Streptomyces]
MKSEISTRHFTQLLSGTPRGARLARLVVAELAANAVTQGQVKGRGFRLTLSADASDTLRVEVADPRGDRQPLARRTASSTDETGRGLLLVDALTARWGTEPWPPSGKVVWAEIGLPHPVLTASASAAQPSTGAAPEAAS